jgi:outer membrane cobalamin receptor
MSRTLRVAVTCLGGIGALAAHIGVYAQQTDTAPMERVEEVIVTGTRSAKAVDKIPGAINVVSEADVSRTLSLRMRLRC